MDTVAQFLQDEVNWRFMEVGPLRLGLMKALGTLKIMLGSVSPF